MFRLWDMWPALASTPANFRFLMNKPDAASKGFHVVRGGADGVDGGTPCRRCRGDRQFRRRPSRSSGGDRRGAQARAQAQTKGGGADVHAASAIVSAAEGTVVSAVERTRQAAPPGCQRARRSDRHDVQRSACVDIGRGFHREDPRRRARHWRRGNRLRFSFRQEPDRLAGIPDRAGPASRLCRRHRSAA